MGDTTRRAAFGAALVAAGFWGLGGTAAQALFQLYDFPAPTLVTLRMLLSGAVLLLVLRPARPPVAWRRFLPFAVVGLFGVQLTFFLAIDLSNAATTTLLQSLALPMMAVYETVVERRPTSGRWVAAVALAVTGTALLISGRPGIALAVTPAGLLFGLLSAVTAAYYTLASRPLIAAHGAWPIATWGFVVGGIASLPYGAYAAVGAHAPPTAAAGLTEVGLAAFVILFGTLLAFGLFLSSVRRIGATEAQVSAAFEPISAAIAAFVFLGVVLTPYQYLGGALVIGGVVLIASLTRPPPRAGPPDPPDPTPGPADQGPPEESRPRGSTDSSPGAGGPGRSRSDRTAPG